jgi:DNA-binding transcriptional regulator GbsR (MarR family)
MNKEYEIAKKGLPWLESYFGKLESSLYYFIYSKASEGEIYNTEEQEWIGMIRSIRQTFKRQLEKTENKLKKVVDEITTNGKEAKLNSEKIDNIIKLLKEKKVLPMDAINLKPEQTAIAGGGKDEED